MVNSLLLSIRKTDSRGSLLDVQMLPTIWLFPKTQFNLVFVTSYAFLSKRVRFNVLNDNFVAMISWKCGNSLYFNIRENKYVVLVATGSFNPPTYMHLRMFGEFLDNLNSLFKFWWAIVSSIFMQPCWDNCMKWDLMSLMSWWETVSFEWEDSFRLGQCVCCSNHVLGRSEIYFSL